MSNCEINIKKCVSCPALVIQETYVYGYSLESRRFPDEKKPSRLYCKITGKYQEVTKCIKEANNAHENIP